MRDGHHFNLITMLILELEDDVREAPNDYRPVPRIPVPRWELPRAELDPLKDSIKLDQPLQTMESG